MRLASTLALTGVVVLVVAGCGNRESKPLPARADKKPIASSAVIHVPGMT
jgi:hypothetical protein